MTTAATITGIIILTLAAIVVIAVSRYNHHRGTRL